MILEENIYKKIEEKTCTNYNGFKMDDGIFVHQGAVKVMLEDLLYEIGRLEEQIEDIIQDRNDNWKPIPVEEQVEWQNHFVRYKNMVLLKQNTWNSINGLVNTVSSGRI